jgi:hypothetical protein
MHREPRRRHGGGRTGHRGADHRSSPAGRHASGPALIVNPISPDAPFPASISLASASCSMCLATRPHCGTGPFHRPEPNLDAARPRRPRHRGRRPCSTGSTGRLSHGDSRESVPVARNPASGRCWPSRVAIRASRQVTTWASSSVPAQCRGRLSDGVGIRCLSPTPMRRRHRSPPCWTG